MGCREAVDGQKGGTVVPIGQEEPSSQQTLNGEMDTQLALLHAKCLLFYLTLPAAL